MASSAVCSSCHAEEAQFVCSMCVGRFCKDCAPLHLAERVRNPAGEMLRLRQ